MLREASTRTWTLALTGAFLAVKLGAGDEPLAEDEKLPGHEGDEGEAEVK